MFDFFIHYVHLNLMMFNAGEDDLLSEGLYYYQRLEAVAPPRRTMQDSLKVSEAPNQR